MIHLVIMAGGIGSRFWPMSTPQCPKQFLDIMGTGRTMIQQTYDRFKGLIDMQHVWVVTSKNFSQLVADQLKGINPQHILLEPCMRNTAPCVAYVSWKILAEDAEATIVVAASDHIVTNVGEFRRVIAQGIDFVEGGERILTLGMQPTRPETGYGYIEQGERQADPTLEVQSTGGGRKGRQRGEFQKLPSFHGYRFYCVSRRYAFFRVRTNKKADRRGQPSIVSVKPTGSRACSACSLRR